MFDTQVRQQRKMGAPKNSSPLPKLAPRHSRTGSKQDYFEKLNIPNLPDRAYSIVPAAGSPKNSHIVEETECIGDESFHGYVYIYIYIHIYIYINIYLYIMLGSIYEKNISKINKNAGESNGR